MHRSLNSNTLGEELKLPRTARLHPNFPFNEFWAGANSGREEPLLRTPFFYYFKHEGVVYPVLILSVESETYGTQDYYQDGTFQVVLLKDGPITTDHWGRKILGWGSLEELSKGKKIILIQGFPMLEDHQWMTDIAKQLAAAGFDALRYYYHDGTGKMVPRDYFGTGDPYYVPVAGYIYTVP